MAVGYGSISDCLNLFPSSPNGFCWDPVSRAGDLGFYLGAAIAVLGTILLVGPNIARSLGKWRSAGPDSEQ